MTVWGVPAGADGATTCGGSSKETARFPPTDDVGTCCDDGNDDAVFDWEF